MERFTGQRQRASGEIAPQAVRYGVVGVILAAVYAALYLLYVMAGVPPFEANTLTWLVVLAFGFALHSRWSFRGHGQRDRPMRSALIFLIINAASYMINMFWIWLFVSWLGLHPATPLAPILLATPWFSFYLNRRITFA